MDEIKLTCAICGVQYRLPPDAIPATGREVQCTACGHVWHAKGPDALTTVSAPPPYDAPPDNPGQTIGSDPAEEDDPAEPRLSRPLPANVLAILRDELEFEQRARAAETEGSPASAQPDPSALPPLPQPATSSPLPATAESTAAEPKPTLPSPAARIATQPAGNSGTYRIGFGLAAAVATLLVLLYVLAPSLGADTSTGAALNDARNSIDAVRLRLRDALLP